LALDVIRNVGPGGNFLSQKHTLKHMRDVFIPQFMDRRPYNVWEEKHDDGRDWALDKARKILTTHQPLSLDHAISRELMKIIASV
jgi:trimethylamine--corrinoid protein Co-methyltransferase